MRYSILFIILLMTESVIAGSINFDSAIQYAKSSEGKLSQNQMSELVKKQAELASMAFPFCIQSTQSAPTNFTVVVKINSMGKNLDSWANVNEGFAECFRRMMESKFTFKPPYAPFYTAFEYTNN